MTTTGVETPVLFELRDVVYRYGRGLTALEGVSFKVREGERVALLGANGSGKSTLLKLLDGLYTPTDGEFRVFGEQVKNLDSDGEAANRFHQRIGLVFQDPDVQLFSPTVGDDVAFGPLQLGLELRQVRERVEAALGEMDIMHLRDRAPFELSGGEKKRAAIASVLSLKPDVILLDEPTASLDPRTKWVLVNLIQELEDKGTTVITATHELEIVPIIARRAIVLGEDRKVLADGPAEEILRDEALLIKANLIHEHLHRHTTVEHAHPHRDGHHSEPDHEL